MSNQSPSKLYYIDIKHLPEKRIPWYKERLITKYKIKDRNNGKSKFLIPGDWMFMKDGLNDFRDGYPPVVENDDIFIMRPNKGLQPNLLSTADHDLKQLKNKNVSKNRFSKDDICYSKILPMQKQRLYNIEEIETGLIQHPLALFPNLEASVKPEIFEEIVDIVDPEMNIPEGEFNEHDEVFNQRRTEEEEAAEAEAAEHADPEKPRKKSSKSDAKQNSSEKLQRSLTKDSTKISLEDEKSANPYRWLAKKIERDRKKSLIAAEQTLKSPSKNEHIKSVTKEFCDWVANLGGDSNNIEETTVTSLFASGYETKPALSVPIHVVELTNVPAELRGNIVMPHSEDVLSNQPKDSSIFPKIAANGNGPRFMKFRYGKWYLPSKMWRKQPANEALEDPKKLMNNKQKEVKERNEVLNQQLAPMHGAKSFTEFIDRTNKRKPEFLKELEIIQLAQAAAENQKNDENNETRIQLEKNANITAMQSSTLPAI